jgi:hypothetical protein
MAMDERERQEFDRMKEQLRSMYTVIVGNPDIPDAPPGIPTRLTQQEKELRLMRIDLDDIRRQIASFKGGWKRTLITLVIGLLIGAVLFGLITWSDALKAYNIVK